MALVLRWVFCTDIRTGRNFCFIHHWLIGFYNRDRKCLLRGTDWFLMYSRLLFVFKRLIFFLSWSSSPSSPLFLFYASHSSSSTCPSVSVHSCSYCFPSHLLFHLLYFLQFVHLWTQTLCSYQRVSQHEGDKLWEQYFHFPLGLFNSLLLVASLINIKLASFSLLIPVIFILI